MRFQLLRILIWGFLITSFTSVRGQESLFQDDHIGSSNGLSSQLTNGLCKDENGNLWIITNDDLNKYDGYSTTIYNSKNSKFKNNPFLGIEKDSKGNVWVSQLIDVSDLRPSLLHPYPFYKIDLFIVDEVSGSILEFDTFFPNAPFNSSNIISIVKRNEVLFIILNDGKVYKYSDRFMYSFKIEDLREFVGIGNMGNYFSYSKSESTLTEKDFNQTVLNESHLPDVKLNSLLSIGKNGHLVFQNDRGIFGQFQIYKNGKFGRLIKLNKNKNNLSKDHMISGEFRIMENENFNSTIHFGRQVHLNSNPNDLFASEKFPFKYLSDFAIDEFNTLYCSSNLGVFIFKPQIKVFQSFLSNDSIGNSVRALINTNDLIASKTVSGQYWSSPNGHYDLEFTKSQELSKHVIDFYRDPKNKNWIWQLGWMPSPILIDLEKRKIQLFNRPNSGEFIKILRSPFSNKLYCIGPGGILEYKTLRDDWEKISLPLVGSINTLENAYFIKSWNEQLLFGTDNGLVILDEKENIAYKFWDNDSKNSFKISFIHTDNIDPEIMWLGTHFNGLIKLNIATCEFQNYDTTLGLSNNNVHAILEDRQERLWISTNKHLNCLSKDLKENFIYTEEEGITNNEFNKYSYYVDSISGNFFFGGLNGYTYFNPDSISFVKTKSPKILFSKIEKENSHGERIVLKKVKSDIEELKFNEEDLSIKFTLNTNHLFKNDLNKFEYRILNFQNQWTSIPGNQFTLNRLPYGKYRIEFIINRNKNNQSSELRTIEVNYLCPYYKELWFYLVSAILIGLITWLFIRIRIKFFFEQNLILENLVRERTNELNLSNETKNKLFAILAHDLRAPINSLSGLAEKVKFLARKNRLNELQELVDQTQSKITILDGSLENILNWALVEMGSIKVKKEKVFITNVIEEIITLYSSQIEAKRIKIILDLNPQEHFYSDRKILNVILRNILNNSIKYSYPEDTILITKIGLVENHIVYEFIDSGLGLSPTETKLGHYNSLNNEKGSGLGLIIINELSEQLNLKFELISNESGGATSRLSIPIETISNI